MLLLLLISPLAGCGGASDAATVQDRPAPDAKAPAPNATQAPNAARGAGDTLRFVAHAEHVPAGFPSRDRPLALANPYEGNARARATGAQLFVAYNCIDCHGADGSGAMGPSLADGRWHFGGAPAEVFESIYQGRPDGMPSWGGRIADDQIWMLVTYVRSLGENKNPSSENFTGRTVERTGH
ncbi:MAG TPA: c-type cytochrome [Gemmatimonadaceae bacterium]|nr:c-type cytochrome [Gemmatimonadaceae bacterium]